MSITQKLKRRQQPSEQMGFCVQCLNFISIAQIDLHCLNCMQNTKKFNNQIDQISQQLLHIVLLSQLNDLTYKYQTIKGVEKQDDNNEKYKFMIRIQELSSQIDLIRCYSILVFFKYFNLLIIKIIRVYNSQSIKKLKDIESELNLLIAYPQTSMTIMMLLSRLLSLVKEKLVIQNQKRLVSQNSFPQEADKRIKTESHFQKGNEVEYTYRQSESNIRQVSELKNNYYSKYLECKLQLSKNDLTQQILVQDLQRIVVRQNYNHEEALRSQRICLKECKINQV